MARTIIAPVAVPSAYADIGTIFTFTAAAASPTPANRALMTGRELLLCKNAGVSTPTVTITSALDDMNRTNDINVTLASGEYRVFPFFQLAGWIQADGYLWFEGSTTDVTFLVLRLP